MLKSKLFACSYILNLKLEMVSGEIWLKRSGSCRQLYQGQGQVPVAGAAGGEHVTPAAPSVRTHLPSGYFGRFAFPCHWFSCALRDERIPSSRDRTG